MPERTAELLQRTDSDSIAVLRLVNGPVNVMDIPLLRAITEAFTDLGDDRTTAVVITGAGRAFSSGADLRGLLDGGPDYAKEFLAALSDAIFTVFTCDLPVVAAVNGHAIAGGAVLACCADARLMADGDWRIGTPELVVGLPFPRVPLEALVHAVGPRVANRLVFGADTMAPAQAEALGLVDEVTEPDALLQRAVEVANGLATGIPPDTFAMTKRQLRRDTVERMTRYRADEDAQAEQLWRLRSQDGWTARYLEQVTRDR
jgi:enoyl-CoA hydratase